MEKLNEYESCVLISSLVLGLLDSTVKMRVKTLGDWNKAKVKQGLFTKTDPAIRELQASEEYLFNALYNTMKRVEKIVPKLAMKKKTQRYVPNEEIYRYAGMASDYITHVINAYTNGREDVTFKDGYHAALDDIEHLMFQKKMPREKALAALREEMKQSGDLRNDMA